MDTDKQAAPKPPANTSAMDASLRQYLTAFPLAPAASTQHPDASEDAHAAIATGSPDQRWQLNPAALSPQFPEMTMTGQATTLPPKIANYSGPVFENENLRTTAQHCHELVEADIDTLQTISKNPNPLKAAANVGNFIRGHLADFPKAAFAEVVDQVGRLPLDAIEGAKNPVTLPNLPSSKKVSITLFQRKW